MGEQGCGEQAGGQQAGGQQGRGEEARLRKPERGLPPQEPEDPSTRPCRCSICCQVPALEEASARAPAHGASADAEITLVGIYPRGLSALALAELARAAAPVVEHLERFCAVLFRLPGDEAGGVLELSTFELIFELVGGAVSLQPDPSLADIGAAAEVHARRETSAWRRHLRGFRRWRVSVHRDHLVQRYKAPAVVPVIGDALAAVGAISLAEDCTAGPEVDLTDFEVEVVAYLSDGVDKLRAANDTKSRGSLGGGQEVLLLGVRSDKTRCSPPSMQVEKGALRSRADNTVAFCVAQRVADLLLPLGGGLAGEVVGGSSPSRPPPSSSSSSAPAAAGLPAARVIVDPMCGVGTYLLALRWVLARRGLVGCRGAELVGVDVDEETVSHLRGNITGRGAAGGDGGPAVAALRGSSLALPLRSGCADLIVVDPPWGQRHSSHNYVKQNMRKWAKEWARVLKPGGAAVVVTICKKVFEEQVIPPLQREGLLELEEAVQFDNKGWTVCRLYVARKPPRPPPPRP